MCDELGTQYLCHQRRNSIPNLTPLSFEAAKELKMIWKCLQSSGFTNAYRPMLVRMSESSV
jgi:hypothetical protein